MLLVENDMFYARIRYDRMSELSPEAHALVSHFYSRFREMIRQCLTVCPFS